jgi:hypothetical protein
MEFPLTVSDTRGTFRAAAMAGECEDGSWEGWIEFTPVNQDTATVYTTPIETRHHDHATVARWASELTRVYAQQALARATLQERTRPASQMLLTLEELVQALDRRIPQTARAGEAAIVADAGRLRASAMQRMALLRRPHGHLDS